MAKYGDNYSGVSRQRLLLNTKAKLSKHFIFNSVGVQDLAVFRLVDVYSLSRPEVKGAILLSFVDPKSTLHVVVQQLLI